MKKAVAALAIGVITCATLSPAVASGLSVDVGQSSESTMIYRLSLQKNFQKSWWQSDVGRLTGYWDLAYQYWDGDHSSSMHGLSLSPVFVYEFSGQRVQPYIEAGIGLAALSKKEFEGREFGSKFSFEDRIGLGIRFGEGHEIGLRAMHYSNAGIKQPNDGIETYSLHYRTSF